MTELSALVEQIAALVDADDPTQLSRETVERTLTDGYAYALTLEGESLRIEREIAVSVEGIKRGDSPAGLAGLAERLAANERDLTRLRRVLRMLHRRLEGLGDVQRQ
ncbi:MAG: hypothetical protein ICV74_04435, partial [Thermoleophilia bacterium]|nr:hypothetical protein [Thermoleophilia bacterium]